MRGASLIAGVRYPTAPEFFRDRVRSADADCTDLIDDGPKTLRPCTASLGSSLGLFAPPVLPERFGNRNCGSHHLPFFAALLLGYSSVDVNHEGRRIGYVQCNE